MEILTPRVERQIVANALAYSTFLLISGVILKDSIVQAYEECHTAQLKGNKLAAVLRHS
jgi:hypothetical protein